MREKGFISFVPRGKTYNFYMKEVLQALEIELKRLASEGVEAVVVDDESMAVLERLGRKAQSDKLVSRIGHFESSDSPEEILPEVEEIKFADSSDTKSNMASIKEKPITARIVKNYTDTDFKIAPIPEPSPFELPAGDKAAKWNFLRDKVLSDPVCNAHVKPQKKVVFGVGNLDAKIFFCGEAPGADEEIQGEPFVGRAGQLLTKIIAAMGLSRSDVYIGNIMNWRPELPTSKGNRPPTQEEMAYCLPYLKAQIEIVNPQIVVALGMTAVHGLLGFDPTRRMGKMRGNFLDIDGRALMVTYHPSYLLQYGNPKTKRLVWEDMMAVMEKAQIPISEKQRRYFL